MGNRKQFPVTVLSKSKNAHMKIKTRFLPLLEKRDCKKNGWICGNQVPAGFAYRWRHWPGLRSIFQSPSSTERHHGCWLSNELGPIYSGLTASHLFKPIVNWSDHWDPEHALQEVFQVSQWQYFRISWSSSDGPSQRQPKENLLTPFHGSHSCQKNWEPRHKFYEGSAAAFFSSV